jgi:hypothetical protein
VLSLALRAHWLVDAPAGPREPAVDPEPAPYLLDLPTPQGTATVIAPPGSPPWTRAAVLPPAADPVWCARVDG